MTGTERARRSDSLYYDTSAISRRVLCDMVSNLESDLEKSKAENAKLQASNEVISEDHSALCERNVKLQKLARGLIYATHPADRARLIADAIELGIEVS